MRSTETHPIDEHDRPDVVAALLPSEMGSDFHDLAYTQFLDTGTLIEVSAIDQAIVAFIDRLETDEVLGASGIVQLPRYEHGSTLLAAILTHLLLRRRPLSNLGPVVLVSSDLRLGEQLRTLSVSNRRRMNLAQGNPLNAHRLTGQGALQPVLGSRPGSTNTAFVYYNTRVGRPTLACRPPVVLIDCTSVRSPAARMRAVGWAKEHMAAVTVLVGDLGDDDLATTLTDEGFDPTVLAMTPAFIAALHYALGAGAESDTPLSSMRMLSRPMTDVQLEHVESPLLNELLTRCYRSLGARPQEETPPELHNILMLLRAGTRLLATVPDYRSACANNIRPGEGPSAMLRRLERSDVRLAGGRRRWGTAYLGSMRADVKALWDQLEQHNPKLEHLWRVLERLGRDTDRQILIRCHSRAAAEATKASLSTGTRTELQVVLWERLKDRLTFSTFKERFGCGTFGAQVLAGSPAPWQFSNLLTLEADHTVVLCYAYEAQSLVRQANRWADATDAAARIAASRLGAIGFDRPMPPVTDAHLPDQVREAAVPEVPDLSLLTILDRASSMLDTPERPHLSPTTTLGGSRTCVPVLLDDGRTWYVEDEDDGQTPVLTLTAGGHAYVKVRDLRAGDSVVVPAGDGFESIHARLVAESRNNREIASLDIILSQFRSAARQVIGMSRTYTEATDRLGALGAHHPSQLRAWADGSTIAPREHEDVRFVFQAAGRPEPDLRVIYSVASALRDLSRRLGYFVTAIASGTNHDAVDRLRAIIGPAAADELLDEFVVAKVQAVRPRCTVPSSVVGHIR